MNNDLPLAQQGFVHTHRAAPLRTGAAEKVNQLSRSLH